MEKLTSGNPEIFTADAVTAAELIAALEKPFDQGDTEFLRSLGIKPIDIESTH